MYDSLICIKDSYQFFKEGNVYKTNEMFETLKFINVYVLDDLGERHWLEDDGQDDFVKTHFKIKGEN